MGESQPGTSASTLVLAPLWRRSLASIINVTAALVAVVVPILLLVAPIAVLADYSDRVNEALERLNARTDEGRKRQSARAGPGVGVGLVMAIERRNRPSFGHRVMGIRKVDAANGRPVRPRSTTVHYLISELITALVPYESSLAKEKRQERLRALLPELVALSKKHAGNRTAVLREGMGLIHEHKANPFTPLARTLGLRLAIHILCIVVLPERQSLPDFAAGIATTTTDQRPPLRPRAGDHL